jgi:Zn-finger nucleic acid-binding protein
MARIAPDCGLPLQPVEFEGIVLDVCPQTGGIWFDLGELAKIRHKSYESLQGLDQMVAQCRANPAIDPSRRRCPVDNASLYAFYYCENRNIQMEECRTCGGVWVDHASLDNLAQHVAKENPEYVPANLSPQARLALADMKMEHDQFMWKAHAAEHFFRALRRRYGPVTY